MDYSPPVIVPGQISTYHPVRKSAATSDPSGTNIFFIGAGAFAGYFFTQSPANAPGANDPVYLPPSELQRFGNAAIGAAGLGRAARILEVTPKPLTPANQCTVSRVEFGANENQTYHAFRHTDEAGMARQDVQAAIRKVLEPIADSLPKGHNNGSANLNGTRLDFTAYRRTNGSINVGRITVPK